MSVRHRAEPSQIIVVDYGGVLGSHHQDPAERRLASILDVSRKQCRALLTERSTQGAAFREGRISEEQFWLQVFDLAGRCRAAARANATGSRR